MPDTPPRSASYTVGGLSPYGFTRTPDYNDKWVPNLDGATSLYERMDLDSAVSGSAAQQSFSNPPFMVAGSTTNGRVPGWMSDDKHPVKRILRGYIRRDDPYKWLTGADLTNQQKASNARLYFMYNPTSVTRTYAALADVSSYLDPANDVSNLPPPFMATADFELFFDRQQEVATLKDNPGCLVDLGVFDLLVGSGASQGMKAPDPNPVTGVLGPDFVPDRIGPPPTPNEALSVPSAAPTSLSLGWDPGVILTIVISPTLSFRGTLTAANATFEKFSHRMTPMRMTLALSMRLYSVGQEPQIRYRGTSAADTASAAAGLKAADPTQTASSQAAADTANAAGRDLAMGWCEKWVGKVNYVEAQRCDNASADDIKNFDAPHIPNGFDCSSFVSRGLCVAGLGSALGINPCTDTAGYVSIADDALKRSSEHPWRIFPINDFSGAALIDFVKAGDIIIRKKGGKSGHAAWIKEVTGNGKYKVMQAASEGKPMEIVDGDYNHIYLTFNYVMRSQPVAYVKPASGETGHLSGTSPQ